MARGSVTKRCQCRDASGGKVSDCRKDHGSWSFTVDTGRDEATRKRKQTTRSGFSTKREAEDAMVKLLADVNAGTWSDDHGTLVSEWLTSWLDDLAQQVRAGSLSVKTFSSYKLHVRTVWIPRLGHLRLRDLRRHHIEKVLRDLAKAEPARRPGRGPAPKSVRCGKTNKAGAPCGNWAARGDAVCAPHGGTSKAAPVDRPAGNVGRRVEKRSASTVNGYRRTLRSALSAAQRRGLITLNPAMGRMDSIPAAEHHEATIWEPEQTARFLEHVGTDRLAALYEIAAYAGLRRAELCGMRWSDIDDDGAGLLIRQTLIEVSKGDLDPEDRVCPVCGADHGGRVFKTPKSRAGRRWVPLVGPAQAALAAHRIQQNAEREPFGQDYANHDLIFCEVDGNPIRPGSVSAAFDDHADACGLPRIRLHDTRHGAASLLLSGGVPIEVVQMILGHSTPAVTRQIYAHVMKKATAAQVEAASEALTRYRREQSVSNAGRSDEIRPARSEGGTMS
jgi:integrase